MTNTKEKKWKKFEKLVAGVQKSLAPNAQVIHNDKVQGKSSQTKRQIDISVRQNIGQYSLFIAIDCKDYKDPVDVKGIEEFIGLIKDVRANKGVMVSSSGFTQAAKNTAADTGIDLYRLVDTADHDWKAYVTMPVLCDIRKLRRYRVEYSSSIRGPCIIPTTDPQALILYRENGSTIDTVFNLLIDKWNKCILPKEPGIYENIKLIDTPTCVKSGENLYHLEVFVNIEVEKNLYFGHLPVPKIRGFEDQKTGGIVSKGFTTGTLDVREVEEKWQKIKSEGDIAVRPTMILYMHDNYPRREIKLLEESENK